MRCELISLSTPMETAEELRALIPAAPEVLEAVAEIVIRVRVAGDEAIDEYTREFDTKGADPRPLEVTADELERAAQALEDPVKNGLELAIANVRRVAEATLIEDREVELAHGRVAIREAPVQSAAVYVPGGRAPYPSTVLMGVVTARAAGVRRVAVCSPPGQEGEIDSAVLAAARLAGADTVYRMGGAQAIAALAYGTETVRPVDVIVGPGNLYVQEAKRLVSSQVGIDSFAGPTDLAIIAGADADPELIALDLLAQAEHGPGTLVVLISDSRALVKDVALALTDVPETGALAAMVQAESAEQALELAQALGPEHLQLVGIAVEPLADRVSTAGCVFVGPDSGAAFGDYIAGSNHILPTAGSARFASALSTRAFRRRFYEVRIEDPTPLARAAAPIARAEGFELHARSMEARMGQNP